MKIAIISDIHEDVVSLQQALFSIDKLKCDEIYCLGDISGFSVPHYAYFDTRNAHECLKLVRENCKVVLAGNHDLHAAKRLSEFCPEFQFPNNWYELDYREREKLSEDRVWLYDHDELDPLYSKKDIEYLSKLPEKHILELAHMKVIFSHYVYPNMSGVLKHFYHKREEYQYHLTFMKQKGGNISFVGHAHSGGVHIVTEQSIKQKGFNRKHNVEFNSCIVVPSIAGNMVRNGFCVFDTDEVWIKAYRI